MNSKFLSNWTCVVSGQSLVFIDETSVIQKINSSNKKIQLCKFLIFWHGSAVVFYWILENLNKSYISSCGDKLTLSPQLKVETDTVEEIRATGASSRGNNETPHLNICVRKIC